jgi:hypothetical protein
MDTKLPTPPAKITPLWIVATFLTFTEIILGYALTQVTGGIQIALTVFVIAFAVGVSVMFFALLWNRPWHFYAPSEYGNVDPRKFMDALRGSPEVERQVRLAKSVEINPTDEEARFSLIDSMSDIVECQFIILMHEQKTDISRNSPYVYEIGEQGAGSGALSPFGRGVRIEGTGLIRVTGSSSQWTLTEEGHRFADWLIKKGRKATYFWTPSGQWGAPKAGGPAAKMLEERKGKST